MNELFTKEQREYIDKLGSYMMENTSTDVLSAVNFAIMCLKVKDKEEFKKLVFGGCEDE